MKVEIEKDGTIRIIAESVIEAGALNWANSMGPVSYECRKCGEPHQSNIVFDCSILLPTAL
jgi:hypothetical protein